MLNSPREVVLPLNSRKYKVKREQCYETIIRIKDRSEKSVPTMQHVIHMDMERMKTNKVYERKLNHDVIGRRGLNWQCRQELQRLRSDERDLAKIVSLPPISKSPLVHLLSRNSIVPLSSIAEEHSPLPVIEKLHLVLGRTSVNSSRTSVTHATPIGKRNPPKGHYHRLRRNSFQQNIAKTSDDRPYLQQHAQIINQEKRLIEQKLKEFLH